MPYAVVNSANEHDFKNFLPPLALQKLSQRLTE
jgi:hypothetical protein